MDGQPGGRGQASILWRDRYEPLERTGSGGQGQIWRALDHQHGRAVALKIRPCPDARQREHLLSEARMLLSLQPHASLPLVRDDFFTEDTYVVVMDWVEGIDLGTLLRDQGNPGLPATSVLAYLADVSAALDHLHMHSPPVVHGDVKPANMICTPSGRVVLVDFGIAGHAGGTFASGTSTRAFVAPEVAAGEDPSVASDIYGMAATARALFTGCSPDAPDSWDGVPALLAQSLGRTLRLALHTDPSRRPRTASELLERLSAWQATNLPTGTVTFLLTDIEGSSHLWDTRSEVMSAVLDRHDEVISASVERHGGRIIKTRREGDSTMSVFERATNALNAALQVQRSMSDEAWPGGVDLRIRASLHTGEAELRDGDYYGGTVNRAARIRSLADGGQIFASQATVQLVADGLPDGVAAIPLGQHRLAGLARPEEVFEIRGTDASTGTRRAVLPSPEVRVPLPPGLSTDAPFVGRTPELEEVEAAWRSVQQGRCELVLVVGEPGIGKTTLASQIVRGAWENGATVLLGRSDEEAIVAYQPFVEALGRFVDAMPSSSDLLVRAQRDSYLARILPQLSTEGTNLPSGEEGEGERYRLLEAVSDLFADMSSRAPVIVLLDDLHWADRPTLVLLRHLVRRCAEKPIMLLGTYRDTDLSRSHPLSSTLADLRRETTLRRIHLTGLGEDEVADLLRAEAGHDLGERGLALATTLRRETEGNPLFVREILQHLVETAAVYRDDEGHWQVSGSLDALGIPEGVKEVIGRRLSRLSSHANAALAIAAAIGREFDLGLLEALVDRTGDTLGAVEEAVAAGVLVEVPGGVERFAFSHALVREALYEELSTARRVRLHRRIVETMERRHADDLEPYLGEIAHHAFEAAAGGDVTIGIDYQCRAADRAKAHLAYEEAATFYERAIELTEIAAEPRGRERCKLLLQLAESCWHAGEFDRAKADHGKAADLAIRVGETDLLADAAIGYGGRFGAFDTGVFDERWVGYLTSALAALGEEDSDRKALVMARLAEAHIYGELRYEDRLLMAREAVAIARRVSAPTIGDVLLSAQWAMCGPSALEERLEMCLEAEQLGDDQADSQLAHEARFWQACIQIETGQIDAARSSWRSWISEARARREPYNEWVSMRDTAFLHLLDGDLSSAEEVSRTAFEMGDRTQNSNAVLSFASQHLLLGWERDEIASLESVMHAIAAEYPRLPGLRAALLQLAEAGQQDLAMQIADELTADGCSIVLRNGVWLLTLTLIAEFGSMLPRTPWAADLYATLLPYRSRWASVFGTTLTFGSMERPLGILAGLLGRWQHAEEHLARAESLHREAAVPTWIAHTLHDRALMRMRRDPSAGLSDSSDLEESLALAEAHGMHRIARRCRQMLEGKLPTNEAGVARAGFGEQARTAVSSKARNVLGRVVRDTEDGDLERRFGSGVALTTVFKAMASSFRPSRAFGFEGAVAFEVLRQGGTIGEGEWWTLAVADRKAIASRGRPANPAATIHISMADLLRLMAGELNPVAALTQRRAVVDGDLVLASRLDDMFGGFSLAESLPGSSD